MFFDTYISGEKKRISGHFRIERFEYDPFGKIIALDGGYADDNAFRFSTKYSDDETNLIYYGYRYYSTNLGRWISRDPFGEEGNVIKLRIYHYKYLKI